MSISGSMYTGAAGLNSHSQAMSIISDNIANVNTVGYKSGRANFTDVLGGVIAGERTGRGSQIGSVQSKFTQGALLGTGSVTDLSIRGDGFFIVDGVHDGVRSNYYTRAGQFSLDGDGYLVNQEGLRVQGFTADGSGNLNNVPGNLQLQLSSIEPAPTASIDIVANLDSDQALSGVAFDIADPSGTSDFSTSLTVYDSLGSSHQLEFYFTKTQDVPNPEWDYRVVTASADVGGAGTYTQLGAGTMTFNTDGSLDDYDLTTVTANWVGAEPADIALDMGTGTASGGSGVDGMTTYAIPSATTFLSQDGYGSGDLAGLQIAEDGTLSGLFTNGQNRALGQLAMARFANNEGLERRGTGLYAESTGSGAPVVGSASSGGRGSLVSGSLEASNVDLAAEFVTLITVQRGFQSNSRTITTADEMLSEIVQLKR